MKKVGRAKNGKFVSIKEAERRKKYVERLNRMRKAASEDKNKEQVSN